MLERRALLALSYPRAQDFADSDARSVRSLVAWLENMKIRMYPTAERRALEQVEDPAWDGAFAKYLADLECPVAVAGAAAAQPAAVNGNTNSNNATNPHAAALRWLLSLALALDYRDSAAELNAAGAEMEKEAAREEEAAAARVAEAAAQAGAADSGAAAAAAARRRLAAREQAAEAFPDLDAPQVRAEIDRLLRMLRLDEGGRGEGGGSAAAAPSPPDADADAGADALLELRLAAARRAVADEVLPTVGLSSSSASAAGPSSSPSCASLLAGVPLGFGTGDARVDQAGALLRLLYLRDLRALQSAVDAAVVEAQEYTANPRTDSSLGRVGR